MLSIEEQNIVDILEDSELDFEWKKSSLSNSLFIHIDIDSNSSNDIVKIILNQDTSSSGSREKTVKRLNKMYPLMLRIKRLTNHILDEFKIRTEVYSEYFIGFGYIQKNRPIGIILVFSKECHVVRKIRE